MMADSFEESVEIAIKQYNDLKEVHNIITIITTNHCLDGHVTAKIEKCFLNDITKAIEFYLHTFKEFPEKHKDKNWVQVWIESQECF